jgi:hypothetical protein
VGRSARDPIQFALIEPYSRRGAAIRWRLLRWTRFDASLSRERVDRRPVAPLGLEEPMSKNSRPNSDVLLHPKAPPLRTPIREEAFLELETFVTGAAFGSAGESDTVERPRTPSVVSKFRFLRA